ncbi:phosphoribosylformylglycinamidine synthase I [Candidatus Woesearchaeota archaeon]|nr:phosphoribosylformylglycinamidine synthase I [Candidatus Woesearchaeota archaeon]
MAVPNALVLRGSGLNCNNETEHALKLAGAETRQAHINDLIEGRTSLDSFHIAVIPGGFSYGDDLGAGKIMAAQISHSLKSDFQKFVKDGKLLIGICNGFQVLVKTGFLPGNCEATLTGNDSGHFEDRWIYIKPAADNIFTRGIKSMHVPVNHGEGKFVASEADLARLERNGQVSFRYCDRLLNDTRGYPENPNGAMRNIAAVTNIKGNVFGMMPHPEKYVIRNQHPRWSREQLPEEGQGLALYRNIVNHAKAMLA